MVVLQLAETEISVKPLDVLLYSAAEYIIQYYILIVQSHPNHQIIKFWVETSQNISMTDDLRLRLDNTLSF